MTTDTIEPAQMRNGMAVLDKRLDRLEYRPEENRGWNVERLFGEHADLVREAAAVRKGRGHRPGPGLNQDREGACVLYGLTHRRNSTPKPLKPPRIDDAGIRADYHTVQHRDPWPGCALGARCPTQPDGRNAYGGTSVHSGLLYGREQGWWSSFWWVGAGSGDVMGDIVKANAEVGGIVFGLNWYESMFEPRPSGLMEVDLNSALAGGHCLYECSIRLKMRLPKEWKGTKEVAVFQQSWGLNHGVADLGQKGGMVYMLLDDLGALMERRGEGAVVIR